MKYKIGLDIGVTSVGWATVLLDEKDEPIKILDMGSRIFEVAEQPKTGASLALPRREARGARRRLRRHRHRIERIKQLIDKTIMPIDQINAIYSTPSQLRDIYEIRYDALENRLSKEDFVRLLIHLAQRRGFKSNRKVDSADKKSENGKLLTAVESNRAFMQEKGYRTIGEMLYKDERFNTIKRNKSENYDNTFLRSMIEDEIKLIFESQKQLGNPYVTEQFCEKYLEIFLSQRQFDEGPGGDSQYGGNQIEKMLGFCTFEKEEYRAFKAQYSSEYCLLLQKVNSLKIGQGHTKIPLNAEQRKAIIDYCKEHATVTYTRIRKILDLPTDILFNISYGHKDVKEVEDKTKLNYLKCYHDIRKTFKEDFANLTQDMLDGIGYCLSAYKNDEKITAYLKERGFNDAQIDLVLTMPSYSKTGNLSVKACKKIIPYLEQGMLYNEACTSAGYDFKVENSDGKSFLLPTDQSVAPELADITNPVVRRAIAQTTKVINSIIRKYNCSPCFISVELARELSKDFAKRKEIEKNQNANRDQNEKVRQRIEIEFGHANPTGLDIVKFKLWEQQDGICPYSLKPIEVNRIFEAGYVDVDHIIPYSISFDDSYNNKVLVFSKENRQKGNRLPLQYVKDKEKFTVWVNNTVKNPAKKAKLLKEKLDPDEQKEMKERNLNDTKYISRFVYNFIRKHLQFAPNDTNRKKTVTAVNGACTAYIRKRWGINKVRADGDLHHAVDAAVIACVTDGMIKKISHYSSCRENEQAILDEGKILVDPETGEVIEFKAKNEFPQPYPYFRQELEMRTSKDPARCLADKPLLNYGAEEEVKPIFVSRMTKHKTTGAAHKETVKSGKILSETNEVIKKVPLTALKLDKNNEIEGYYNPSSDVLLYNALKQRLMEFGGKGEKAFAEPFYKPKSDGTEGPIVKKVKVVEKSTLNVSVQEHKGIADNGSMVRVDVFRRNGKYYLVPIYVSDTVKDVLPNKAIAANKSYDEWTEMKEEEFLFSLYSRDLIKIIFKKDAKFSLVNKDSTLPKEKIAKEMLCYYISTNISTASIKVINHDNTYEKDGLGVKGLPLIEKYQVDALGNFTKVKKEKRMGFKK